MSTWADLMVPVEPKAELGEMFDAAGRTGKPRVGQIAFAYDPDRDAAVQRAHKQFRWFRPGLEGQRRSAQSGVLCSRYRVRHARSRR